MDHKEHSEPLCTDRYCAGYNCECSCHAPQELLKVLRDWVAEERRQGRMKGR